MPQLLIRGVGEDLKRSIAIEAARNGRSVQAELLSSLEARYGTARRSMVDTLLDAGSVDGPDFEPPAREPFRDFSFE